MTPNRVRVAALADLHCTKTSQGAFQALLAQAAAAADLLVLCGDLTDHGLPEEARVLVKEMAGAHIPMVAVLGNHDFHDNQVDEIERMGRLRRFLPPQVADLIVASGSEKQLESHRREITALLRPARVHGVLGECGPGRCDDAFA